MKTKFKKNGRRLLAAILCLVMAVMALPMSAFAWTSEEGVSCTSSFGDYYVGSDGGSKISRIVERFNLASVDTASIVTEAEKAKDEKNGQPEPEITTPEKAEKDKLLDELMGKPVGKEENAPNPSVAKTEKSPQSEPISEKQSKSAEGATMTKDKPSVKEELRKIKESRKEQEADKGTSALDKSGASDRAKSANGKTEHKQPQRKKKHKKSKEAR